MSPTPLISFIIPAYNVSGELIRPCLQSILDLMLAEDEREIIVVDDGSEPKLELPPYIYNKVKLLRQEHAGQSSARNLGLDHACGRYIQFVDADDRLYTAAYERIFEIVREQQPDVVAFEFQDCYEGKAFKLPSIRNISAKLLSGTEFLRKHNIHGASWSYLYRRDLIGDLRFSKEIVSYGEDEDFVPRVLLKADRIVKTSLKAYLYIHHHTSITSKLDREHVDQRLRESVKVIDHLSDYSNSLSVYQQAALQRRIHQLAMDLIVNSARLSDDEETMNWTILQLRERGLYPLPARYYGLTYRLFGLLSATKPGLKLIRTILRKR